MATVERKKLKKYPGYDIAKTGEVRAIKPNGEVVPLVPQPDDDGRPFVGMYGVLGKPPGRAHHASVARLVLEAFDRPPKADEVVGYRDGDYSNARRSNLFWSTRSDNAKLRAKRAGRVKLKAVAAPAKKKPRTRDTSPSRTRPSRKLARAA